MYGKSEVDSFFNLLIEHYLNIKRIKLILEPDFKIRPNQVEFMTRALAELNDQIPIQYIIGETEFYGLKFKVDESVLIPRPETEELVEATLKLLESEESQPEKKSILDIGTGSGCIAISLAYFSPKTKVYALDVSEAALKTARKNATINDAQVSYFKADILKPDTWNQYLKSLKLDVIISNPPYVRQSEKLEMKPNVLNNEPSLALFVEDENPLVYYKAICDCAQLILNDGGHLIMEINEFLGAELIQLMNDNGFMEIVLKKDIYGKDRIIQGKKMTK